MAAQIRVLHIEDSESDVKLVEQYLRDAGYAPEIEQAASAEAMTAALARCAWDVVLAADSLPQFRALDALRILQASGQALPFIVVSETADEDDAVTAIRAGAHDFVAKNRLERLAPAIDREVRAAAARREQRQAEGKPPRPDERLTATLDALPDGGQIIGFDWRYLYVNEAVAAQGRKRKEDLLGRTMLEAFPGVDQTPLFATLQECMQQRVARRVENEFQFPDGSSVWFDVSIQPVPEGLFVLSEDITERKRGEILRQALLDIMQGSAVTDDLQAFLGLVHQAIGRVMYAQNFFVTLYNAETGLFEEVYSVDAFDPPAAPSRLERSASAFVFRSGQPLLLTQARFEALVAQGEVDLIGTNSPSWLGVPLNTSKGPIGVMVVQDYEQADRYSERDAEFLTSMASQVALAVQRRQAESALGASERRFRALIENSSDAITLISRDGTVMYDSPSVPGMLGYAPEELLGRNAFALFHPDDVSPNQRLLGDLLQAPGGRIDTTFRLRHKDGTWRWIEAIASNLLEEPGVRAVVVNYRDFTARRQSELQAERQLERLASLRAIDRAITSSLDLGRTLEVFLEQVTTQLGVDAADVWLLDARSQTLAYAAGRGFRSRNFEQVALRLGEGRVGRAALERRIVEETGLVQPHQPSMRTALLGSDDFVNYYGVPLIAKGQVMGVLEVFQRTPLQPDPEWLDFLEALSSQAAIALENATLFANLQQAHGSLVMAYDATIEGWSRALDLRDRETEGHTRRVTDMALRLARALGFGDETLVHVRRGALLHDIGKMGVPDSILLKPGPLTAEEWTVMRRHPVYAYEMLRNIAYLRPALDIPYCHHEKWNGSGYPRGLRGEQIPLAARAFAVADVWDALRSDRPYRAAWPADRVREHIGSQAGVHFDPAVTKLFLSKDWAPDRR